ncbi:hypothetical protein [Acinetobacter baumannii]|uniref:hypothetical protein n=1 Tax=Acinetobacter baumannii TaxID=470 RepID=UPI000D33F048|nr:hypothetical protein [Acinetobacter baumannii]MDC5267064.1 hypothetical protein [Acinetobacter baumannii]MDC5370928.1 hypothetical protein [Acinetobacter baumannii]
MDNWKHIITAFVVTIVATILIPLFSRLNPLKLSLACFLLSTLGFGVVATYGRKSNNRGVDGDWGAHGLWKEIFNLELVTISVGIGVLITLTLMVGVYFSKE